jgi:outer membrane protein assembly factor BamD
MRLLIAILTAFLLLPIGCSSTPKKTAKSDGKSLSGTDEQIFVGDTVEKNYDPNVILKRAESFFDKEEYAEAVIEYQHFLELHRVHTLAPYAQFKLAESFFKQVRSVDRDPDPIYKALESYERLRKDWPSTRWDGDAHDRIRSCHNMIAQHYVLVGQFYFRREAYLAAAHRFEAVITQYPDLEAAADALYYLALAYHELGAEDWARERLVAFTAQYPTHPSAGSGRKLLAKLDKHSGDTAVASAQPAPRKTDIAAFTATTAPPAPTAAIPNLGPVTTLSNSPSSKACRLGVWC